MTNRLIFKFRGEKKACLNFLQWVLKNDRKEPEIWLSLCLALFAYGEFRQACRVGLAALKKSMNAFDKNKNADECMFNIRRILFLIYSKKGVNEKRVAEIFKLTGAPLSQIRNKKSLADVTAFVTHVFAGMRVRH